MPSLPRCVYCREQPVNPRWRPFCSQRCKLSDLGQWLSGGYSVPAAPTVSDESDDGSDQAEPEESRP